jgi:hypothetical protein
MIFTLIEFVQLNMSAINLWRWSVGGGEGIYEGLGKRSGRIRTLWEIGERVQ